MRSEIPAAVLLHDRSQSEDKEGTTGWTTQSQSLIKLYMSHYFSNNFISLYFCLQGYVSFDWFVLFHFLSFPGLLYKRYSSTSSFYHFRMASIVRILQPLLLPFQIPWDIIIIATSQINTGLDGKNLKKPIQT